MPPKQFLPKSLSLIAFTLRSPMSRDFACPYLKAIVQLTDERSQHITQTHPDTLPEYLTELEATLADPDLIRSSDRYSECAALL